MFIKEASIITMPTGFEKKSAERATDCGETPKYDSKVVAPRNPTLLRGPVEEEKMTPSAFMKEVAQTTEEKLANTHHMRIPQVIELLDMGDTTYQKSSTVDLDEPMFQPFPSEITFQQFEPHEIYEVPLLLRNNDKVSRLVKVFQADSPYFKIISPADIATKVAPGMPTIFRIQFLPTAKQDYNHELICMTEREKFIVPVKAIGARAILDFPDAVNFSSCPVKYPTPRMLLVRNIGNREAKFSLEVPEPFSVSPANGILAVGESFQIEVTFQPMTVGDHSEDLIVSYDTGENIYVTLYGASVDLNVRLDKNSLRIENTFISMANQRTISISNRSDVIVHFCWKSFATMEEELQQRERYQKDISEEYRLKHDSFLEECILDPTLRDQMAVLSRTYQNKEKLVEGDNMLFTDEVFSVMPLEGDLWPNSSMEVNIIFKPKEAKMYTCTAYCDITGRETRLPLRLRGDGIGPKVSFSVDTLDMGHIFVGSTHSYEVVLANKGDIDAHYLMEPSNSTFGPRFTFSPNAGLIVPGGYQAIQIVFSSPLLGEFNETFNWTVEGLPENIKIQLKGTVIGPTFHFDVPKLKFGTISYGFKCTQVATLVNTSLVPMTFFLRVPSDGHGKVVSVTNGDTTLGKTNLNVSPKEFEIEPETGTISPQSEMKISIALTSNTVKKYDLSLVVDVEGVGDEIVTLPITAKCVVSPVGILTPILDYTRCFLNHPYEQNARIVNDSDLPVKYDLIPQEVDETTALLYTSPQPSGVIPAQSTAAIPMVITPRALEEIDTIAEFSIFGSSQPPLQVQLMCVGEGPVVHVDPEELDWGQTPVLSDLTKSVILSNESLIPAPFVCAMVRPKSLWKVDPAEGVIPPEECMEVKLTVNLDDNIRFQDKLAIEFKYSQTRFVKLHAYGFGTTIISNPLMTPAIELGHHFSNGPCRRTFTLTNRGRRHQQLFWSTEGFNPIKFKSKEFEYNPLDVKYQRMPPPKPPPRPVFSLTPSRFELEAGQSIEVVLEGESDEPKVVKERMLCHAIIGRSSGKERIMKTDVSIEFISPVLEFSTRALFFRVDKYPDDVLEKQQDSLILKNVSSLPLNCFVELEHPFHIIDEKGEELTSLYVPLGINMSTELVIQFDPAYQDDLHSRITEKFLSVKYKEHPHLDYVTLKGEVYFPNLTFEKDTVDFGCILNDTEVTRYVNITNNSPMPVKYKWSFLEPAQPIILYPQPIPEEPVDELDDEEQCIVAFEEPDQIDENQEVAGDEDEDGNEEQGMQDTGDEEQEKQDESKESQVEIPPHKEPETSEIQEEVTESIKAATLSHLEEPSLEDVTAGSEVKSETKSKKSSKKGGKSSGKSSKRSGSRTGGKSVKGDSQNEDNKVAEDTLTVDQILDDDVGKTQTLGQDGDHQSIASGLFFRPHSAVRRRKAKINYIQTITEPTVVGIEEVFDILPLYGSLMPGESDTVTFTFYGHTEIGSEAKALCHVEGGPCYEILLSGEASVVQYDFDTKFIDYGKQMFDTVSEAEITLTNTGKVGFDFTTINMDPSTSQHPIPGVPVVIPHTGHIEANQQQKLQIKFLPGVPEKFHKSFEIQVAHFVPDSISICGEGVFPRISLDLPRQGDEEGLYDSLMKEAKETLERDSQKKMIPTHMLGTPIGSPVPRDPSLEDVKSMISLQNEFPSELGLQMEVERLLIKEFAAEMQQCSNQVRLTSGDAGDGGQDLSSSYKSALMASIQTSGKKKTFKQKARLPDYILDFGFVVLGTVRTHIVRATNTGYFPVSFSADRLALNGTGFHVELDRVRQLPGYPEHETVDFRVSFDPRGANVGLGEVEALVPINIVSGPCVFLRLHASVTMPDMQVSTDRLEFGSVQCGQCKVVTIQLFNHNKVKCEWTSLPTEKEKRLEMERILKIDKHMPLHLRRKLRPDRPRPKNFEMLPASGVLLPGQRVNVQVKFMPTEEKIYSDRVVLRISQSSQRLTIVTEGSGLEPQLEFSQTLLEFGPILPHSPGDEVDVVVRNPCSFPIEFYSLEFDKQYLEEEKMLRLMKGYDEQGTLLLPPRNPGEKLPQEIMDFFEEQKRKLEEEEKARLEAAAAAASLAAQLAAEEAQGDAGEESAQGDEGAVQKEGSGEKDKNKKGEKVTEKAAEEVKKEDVPKVPSVKSDEEKEDRDKKDSASSLGVGDLEITPVSAAIARHLGIDLSAEGKAAMRRRGVGIVVHGAPLSGKTNSAIGLAKYFEAALLTVDSVILEAISSGNTPAGLRARELCSQAAKAQLAKEGEGSESQQTGAGGLSVEAVTAHSQGQGNISAGGGGTHSVISNRKTSTISGNKPEEQGSVKPSDKKDKKDKKQESDNQTLMSGSPPPAAPIARRLSVSASVAGDEGLMSCLLPEELLVEILAERLQLNDCHRGVVFDGLETLFSPNLTVTARAILKALNNRKYIYFVTLKLEQCVLQAREQRQQEERERLEKENEEAERIRLEEMSEDEYDALPEEEKAEVDRKRLKTKKERMMKKEMEERLERERKERELAALLEEKKLEDDKNKKKKGSKQGDKEASVKGAPAKKSQDGGRAGAGTSQAAPKKGPADGKHEAPPASSDQGLKVAASGMTDRPESHGTAGSEQKEEETGKKKKKDKGRPVSQEMVPGLELEKEPLTEEEIELNNRFKSFEHSMKDIEKLLKCWSRSIGHTVTDPNSEDADLDEIPAHPPSGRKAKTKAEKEKEKEKERERERLEKERLEREKAVAESGEHEGDGEKSGEQKEEIGIPHMLMDASEVDPEMVTKILEMEILPSAAEVLDGLGLGPTGPPIPPDALFSVIPYPVKRKPPVGSESSGHYSFVASSADDPNVGQEEKPKEVDPDLESVTPDKVKEDVSTPSGKGRGKDKLRPGAESSSSRKRSAKGTRGRKSSLSVTSPPPGHTTPGSDYDNQSSTTGELSIIQEPKNPKLTIFRWTVEPQGEVTLRLSFASDDLGQFDQTLSFEIVGTRRRYQLFCRGVCSFPYISREPRIVFPHRKKSQKSDEIVHKKYLLNSELLQMGPLLAGKPRDRYREGKYPENMEKLTIKNTSPLEAELSFCFQQDSNATTFLLEPPNLTLKPGESQELTVWAYPKNQGYFEDAIVCCIKENPEPVLFKIACYGVRPELELDKKQLHFERVLLHRKDTKTIYLRNSKLLPVAWRLSGLEALGDEFSVSVDSGIIEPKSEFALNANFRALRPINLKKMVRLEVSDVENIMGLLQTENIQVLAEAYDVALDMSFPKGADGGLDFGIIRVMDETKQTCSLKNKGRYEISYSFMFEPTETCGLEIVNLFSVIPQKGVLVPNERPTQVQVIFRSRKELTIKDEPILKCQIIEPNISDSGETIASIPVKLSVRSIFSKYNVFPTSDINFGAVLVSQRKQRSFIIENKGEFDFKYIVNRMMRDMPVQPPMLRGRAQAAGVGKRSKSRDGSSSGRSIAKPKKADSIRLSTRQEGGGGGGGGGGGSQTRLQLGMFTVYPAYAVVSPGNQAVVQVDCLPEAIGRGDEDLAIEITDRDPADHPQGIPYKLLAEACIPSINLNDFGAIFEEHRVVKNLSIFLNSHHLELGGGGVFGEDENRFIFGHVLVGRKAKARFKISNSQKVVCDVVITCKMASSKASSKLQDIFEVDPPRASIPAHSHVYATVTFSPPSMQTYVATFEVQVEGLTGPQAKARALSFEVQGEGNLPRVAIVKPALKNKKGVPLLLFTRILVGRSQTLPLCLRNDGTLPSKVAIDLVDESGFFKLQPIGDTKLIYPHPSVRFNEEEDSNKHPHTASLIITVGEEAHFNVTFTPKMAKQAQALIKISVSDNQYEDRTIQIVGEGYQDDITLDNIPSLFKDDTVETLLEEDDVTAAPSNLIEFGDCHVGEEKSLIFAITNHSQTDAVRFQWPDNHEQLKFSPALGHLHAGCAKDITVTFKSTSTKNLNQESVVCKVSKISFDKPVDQVLDWDDRLRTVKWVDIPVAVQRPSTSGDPSGRPKSNEGKEKEKEGKKERDHKKGTSTGQAAAAAAAAAAAEALEKEKAEIEMKKKEMVVETPRPAKKKVIETEPEPPHTVVEESSRVIDLRVSGNADFCKFKCKTDSIHFRDTLMFQTRVFVFQVTNKGNIRLPFNWQVVMEEDPSTQRKSVSFADGDQMRLPSRASTASADVVDLIPFTIEPDVGSIPSGKKQNFTVRFSPLDVRDYEARLICRIPNLEEGKQGPVIAVRAKSVMPYCHFELEDSDYITGSRRNPELKGPGGAPPGATLDPNTRVIEFKSVGVDICNQRHFFILNPTNSPYTLIWTCEDEVNPKEPSPFKCLTPQGEILPGKKIEVGFQFSPTGLGIQESFWRFTIPEQNISVPFLLVGDTHEPAVSTDRSHINFKSLLLGNSAEECVILVNNENKPFDFEISKNSCHSDAFSSHLHVTPMDGSIPAHGKIPLNISFKPDKEKEVNFNVEINIKKKTKPICLNVKAEGYSMNAMLVCEDSKGQKVELSPQGINEIIFGEVEVNEKAVRSLFIVNTGKFNFDFEWSFNESSSRLLKMLSISPENGAVPHNDRRRCVVAFKPPNKVSLKGVELNLKIANGPSYTMRLHGQGVAPGLHFSFVKHDFGPCFIHRAGMPPHQALLTLSNRDSKDISVDCTYTNTAHLEINFEAVVLKPGDSKEVNITFYPREAQRYHETVVFEVNGLSKSQVEILGEGTEMKVEVENPKDKIVKFGALRVGQTIKRTIPIINRSPAPLSFTVALTPLSPILQQVPSVLKLAPSHTIDLKPKGGKAIVEMVFSPKSRIPQFTEEVMLECAGLSQPLLVVTGSCQGIEITLDQESIPFGAVVLRSSTTRKLVMYNTGDVGARFNWNVEKFAPDFSISPAEGYISPGMNVTLEISFHPAAISQDIRYDKLQCSIEGSRPLRLVLTGMCVGCQPQKEIIHFNTHVRVKDHRNLTLHNRTNMRWDLRPVIEGEHWSCADAVVVEPQQSKPFEITYRPLIMTTEGKKHQGTIFFALPDGTGLMYNMVGVSEPPKAAGNITQEVPSKTMYTQVLSVSNWLKRPQRFKVLIEMLKPDKLDPATTMKGLDYIDVPGLSKRDYKLHFFCHKDQASYSARVVFRSEQSGEFQFYYVTFKSTPPGVMGTIEMTTPVRLTTSHTIMVENPLSLPATFQTNCSIPDVMLPPQLMVPPQSEGTLSIEYLPLKVGEIPGKLQLTSNDLGLYQYDMMLTATPAGPEKAVYFRAPLGGTHTQGTKFLNFAKVKTEYVCKIDSNDFHCDKSITAAPGSSGGTEVNFEVTFEPSHLGESRASLTISSPVGGEYIFPLFGTCIHPKPQGPYTVKANSTISIPFRNVFSHTTPFTFQVDNPSFSCKNGESIRGKKTHNIIVGFEGNLDGSKAPKMGKLVVSCARSAGGAANVSWTFYLKGITP